MKILAIDPGPQKSAWCLYDSEKKVPIKFCTLGNNDWSRLEQLPISCPDKVVFEKIASYGMPVGATVFDTCMWMGRMVERIVFSYCYREDKHDFMTRKEVMLHICGSGRGKDSNIIQALKDRFGEKGTKKKPGILYGIKADEWQALALAVTYAETKI
jgi:hypothetical protein